MEHSKIMSSNWDAEMEVLEDKGLYGQGVRGEEKK